MRALLDANVLMPTTLRGLLLAAAAGGGFAPLWSARILEEWARAARRLPGDGEAVARAEIARLRAAWPQAEVAPAPDLEATLALPDPADRHVLAAAIAGGVEALVTRNRRDFPTRTLARHGILLRDPDGFLCEIAEAGIDLRPAAEATRAGGTAGLRAMLRRAGLPRLGRVLDPPARP